MKLISKIVVAVVTAVFILSAGGCKKGDADPALSLRSRKARLCGEWRLNKGYVNVTYVDYIGFARANLTYILEPSRFSLTETNGVITKGAYILNLHIKKDGTFTISEVFSSSVFKASGVWDFTKASAETKNKEQVFFEIREVSQGESMDDHLFNFFDTGFTFKIDELRNKKMVLSSSCQKLFDPENVNVYYAAELEMMQ